MSAATDSPPKCGWAQPCCLVSQCGMKAVPLAAVRGPSDVVRVCATRTYLLLAHTAGKAYLLPFYVADTTFSRRV